MRLIEVATRWKQKSDRQTAIIWKRYNCNLILLVAVALGFNYVAHNAPAYKFNTFTTSVAVASLWLLSPGAVTDGFIHRRYNRRDRERLVPQLLGWETNNVLVPQLLGRNFQKARNFTTSSHQNAGFSIWVFKNVPVVILPDPHSGRGREASPLNFSAVVAPLVSPYFSLKKVMTFWSSLFWSPSSKVVTFLVIALKSNYLFSRRRPLRFCKWSFVQYSYKFTRQKILRFSLGCHHLDGVTRAVALVRHCSVDPYCQWRRQHSICCEEGQIKLISGPGAVEGDHVPQCPIAGDATAHCTYLPGFSTIGQSATEL